MGRSDADHADAHNAELTIDPHVVKLLKLRAYEQGFAIGAAGKSAKKRHTVDVDTHEHWRRGFEAGRAAAERSVVEYSKEFGL